MRSALIWTTTLVVLLLVGSLGVIVPESINVPSQERVSAQYTERAPISIDGNEDFTAANGVTGGSGTAGDPYIIEGWEISIPAPGYGIWVRSTTAFFVVQDVEVSYTGSESTWGVDCHDILFDNVGNGTVTRCITVGRTWTGIELNYCDNCHTRENTVSDNYHGIAIYNCSNCSIVENTASNMIDGISVNSCVDISISGNNAFTNTMAGGISDGIYLQYCERVAIEGNILTENYNGIYVAYSQQVSVYHNNLVRNTRQAFDSNDGSNQWDNGYPSGGNYWSDYTGVDGNGDGIGDTPYVIDADSQDSYPLMEPYAPVPSGEELGLALVVDIADSLFEVTDASIKVVDLDDMLFDGVLKGTIILNNRLFQDVTVVIASSTWIRVHPSEFTIPGASEYPNNVTHSSFIIDVRENTPKDCSISITSNVGWSKVIPLRVDDFLSIESTAFDISNDGYSFRNFETDVIVTTIANCYGMSVTSCLYFEELLEIPAGKTDTYSLTFDEAKENIVWYQQSRYGVAGGGTVPNNFNDLTTLLSSGHPAGLFLATATDWNPSHAAVAYTLIQIDENDYRIALYDSNYPFDPEGLQFESYRWASYSKSSDSFSYYLDDGSHYVRFGAFQPQANPIIDVICDMGAVFGGALVIVDCPVDVVVQDDVGRLLGYSDGAFVSEIPDAEYVRAYDSTFMYLPRNASVNYTIDILGLDTGIYNVMFLGGMNGTSSHMVNFTGVRTFAESLDRVKVLDVTNLTTYSFRVMSEEKTYSMTAHNVENDSVQSISLPDISILCDATHGIEIVDWCSLDSDVNESVSFMLDQDSDGTFEGVIDVVSGLNCCPIALWSADPEIGDLSTMFCLDAAMSWDLEDTPSDLEVRWDFDGDGTWDTDWSTEKVAYHQYSVSGTYTVCLEVRDTGGLTNVTSVQVEVVEAIPEFSTVVAPVLSLLFLMVLVARGRLRRDKPKKPG